MKNKSLRAKIEKFLQIKESKVSLNDIYDQFPDEKKTTVRGRIYDGMNKENIRRVEKGLYISSNAIIELADSLIKIDELIDSGDKFDFIFLDIPYEAAGQKGGNRNLFDADKISPDQFGVFIKKIHHLLKYDNSPIAFMFTSGKTSKKAHDKYFSMFENSGLILHKKVGTYTKMWKTGNRMNMGKYLMPHENIYFFSKSGEINGIDNWKLNFREVPNLRGYPTEKPKNMIKQIIKQATSFGNWILDPFSGSGIVLESCLELGRKCHIIDSSEKSIKHTLSRVNIIK